jgi:dimethylamine corrinoid protein
MDFEKLKTAMGELDENTVLSILDEVMADGGTQVQKAMEACQEGMNTVGNLFQTGEYFVGDLIFAGDLMTRAMDMIKPGLAKSSGCKVGRMIFCTVQHDLHDIGKNIVKAMLEANGIEVIDLGIDVAPETIVAAVKENNVKVIALSGVLTLAIDSMKATADALIKAGMRDNIKVIIGGAPVTEAVCSQVGADAWAINPQKTVQTCTEWLTEKRR